MCRIWYVLGVEDGILYDCAFKLDTTYNVPSKLPSLSLLPPCPDLFTVVSIITQPLTHFTMQKQRRLYNRSSRSLDVTNNISYGMCGNEAFRSSRSHGHSLKCRTPCSERPVRIYHMSVCFTSLLALVMHLKS